MLLLSTAEYLSLPTTGSIAEMNEIFEGLLDIRDEGADVVDLLQSTGRYVPTKNKRYYNYASDWLYTSTTTTSAGAKTAGSGGSETVTVGSTAKLRAGMTFYTPQGAQGYVRSITNATTMVVEYTEAFTVVSGDTWVFPSNAIGEGGFSGDMPETDWIESVNQVQIFETSYSVSDLHKAGKTVLKMPNGKHAYFYKLQHDAYKKHMSDISNAFIMGKYATATAASAYGGNTVFFTRGLDAYIENADSLTGGGGVSDTTATSNVIDKADFKAFNRSLDAARSPAEGMLWCGADIGNEIDDLFDNEMAASINYSTFGKGNAKQKAVDLGIKSFHMYGRSFHKSKLKCLDHPNVTGATGQVWNDYAYFIPTGKIKSENGQMADRIQGRYLEVDGVNSRFHEKFLGGLAPVPTERTNKFEVAYTSWEGLDIKGVQQFGKIKLAV